MDDSLHYRRNPAGRAAAAVAALAEGYRRADFGQEADQNQPWCPVTAWGSDMDIRRHTECRINTPTR